MLIKSNYKDYYDYLQGIYGTDEKVVYERLPYSNIDTNGNWVKSPMLKLNYQDSTRKTLGYVDNYEYRLIGFCGIMYSVHIFNGGKQFLFGCTFKQYRDGEYNNILSTMDKNSIKNFNKVLHDLSVSYKDESDKFHLKETSRNVEENCPVILLNEYIDYRQKEPAVTALNIRLTDFGMNQIISPHDAYISISNFLSRERTISDNRTDKEKIVGRGFDIKSSFRH